MEQNKKQATFAGGCFWCMEAPFEAIDGVYDVRAGYAGGHKENPTYEEVCSGETGHLEVIHISYDPNKITFKDLLEVFWRQIDPTDDCGQFQDRGTQYLTAILYHDDEQKKEALNSKEGLAKMNVYDKPIVTKVIPFDKFYDAEEYHQDFYKKNPLKHKQELEGGRKGFLAKIWK